tara:strand:- start:21354 stop:21623 length:270 start_codon:yes stop_codon:yes gene_type:complete
MPNNMRRAGMSYNVGGARDKKDSKGDGGMEYSYQNMFAKMGGAMGTTDVMDVIQGASAMQMRRGGSMKKKKKGTKKGMVRKTARRAYKK